IFSLFILLIKRSHVKYLLNIKLKEGRIYMALNEVVIVSALRTPIGTFNGKLKDISAVELGAKAIKSVIEEVSINVDNIDEVIMRSEEHTSELQSRFDLVCRLLLEKKKI